MSAALGAGLRPRRNLQFVPALGAGLRPRRNFQFALCTALGAGLRPRRNFQFAICNLQCPLPITPSPLHLLTSSPCLCASVVNPLFQGVSHVRLARHSSLVTRHFPRKKSHPLPSPRSCRRSGPARTQLPRSSRSAEKRPPRSLRPG